MTWTDDRLAALPVRNDVRQRGLDMTRLETFCDAAFAFAVTLLYLRARKAAPALRLDAVERLRTRQEFGTYGVLALTGLASALWAGLLPPRVGVWAGFVYCVLPLVMPLLATRHAAAAERLKAADRVEPAPAS